MRRCFVDTGCLEGEATAENPAEQCLSLAHISVSTMRRESSHHLPRATVALNIQMDATPLMWRVRPSQVQTLSSWASHLQSSRAADPLVAARPRSTEPAERGAAPEHGLETGRRPLPRRHVVLSVRTRGSVDGMLESLNGALAFRLPCLTGTFRHAEGGTKRARTRTSLRVARPRLLLRAPPMLDLEVVEWCEEKIYGDEHEPERALSLRRSACWLMMGARYHDGQPPELAVTSLPLGLCLPLAPILRVLTPFAAAPGPVAAEPETSAVTPTDPPATTGEAAAAEEADAAVAEEADAASAPAGAGAPPPPAAPPSVVLEVSIGAVSARLFAESPFTPGVDHIAACLGEASARCKPHEPMRAKAELSVSLFEQAETAGESEEARLSPLCVVDDLLRPCTISIFKRPAADGGGPPLECVEADSIHVEVTSRSHLCRLLNLLDAYSGCLEHLPSAPEPRPQERRGERPPKPAASAGAQGGMSLLARSVSVNLAGQEVGSAAPVHQIFVKDLSFTTGTLGAASQQLLQCSELRASLSDRRQSMQASQCSVTVLSMPPQAGRTAGSTDVTVSVEGAISSEVVTGTIFGDSGGIWPSAAELRAARRAAPGAPARAEARSEPEGPQPPTEPARAAEAAPAGDVAHAEAAPELKFRVLLSSAECRMCAGRSDPRALTLQLLNFSIFSWPPLPVPPPSARADLCSLWRKRMDLSTEALSFQGSGPGVAAAAIFSPFSIQSSIVTLSPERPCLASSRTEVDFSFSPLHIAAGAWQLRLLSDVMSFYDPEDEPVSGEEKSECTQEAPAEQPAVDPLPTARSAEPALEGFEHLVLELRLGPTVGGRPAEEAAARGALPLPVLCGMAPEELDPWQAARLPPGEDGCQRYAVRLDRPVRISSVAAWVTAGEAAGALHVPGAAHGFEALSPGPGFQAEAWDDAQRAFVDVTGASAEEAVHSSLVALRLRELCLSLLVQVTVPKRAAVAAAPSELAVSWSTPRLTWCVLHSSVCCGTAPLTPLTHGVPAVEDSFGDFSFLSTRFALWKGSGEGMALGLSSEKVGIDLYEMPTLSLRQVVAPEENSLAFRYRSRYASAPTAAPLRVLLRHEGTRLAARSAIDLRLGALTDPEGPPPPRSPPPHPHTVSQSAFALSPGTGNITVQRIDQCQLRTMSSYH